MARRRVGCDPGSSDGAVAVVVPGPRVVAWWAYSEVAAGIRVRWIDGAGRPCCWTGARLTLVAEALGPLLSEALLARPDGPPELVLEGLFQARRSGLLVLAESRGVWRRSLEPLCPGGTLEPRAQDWRAAVLGLGPRVDAHRAEEAAIRWARRNLTWSRPPDGLTRVEEGAVCEAAAIACYPASVASG